MGQLARGKGGKPISASLSKRRREVGLPGELLYYCSGDVKDRLSRSSHNLYTVSPWKAFIIVGNVAHGCFRIPDSLRTYRCMQLNIENGKYESAHSSMHNENVINLKLVMKNKFD